jgi:hypothetical protein
LVGIGHGRPAIRQGKCERGVPPFPQMNPTRAMGLSTMEMPSATKCFQTFASPFSRQRGRAPGALSHLVSANRRARLGADHSRNLGGGAYELQCSVARIESTASANASRRQEMVPDDCGATADASGTDRTHSYSAAICLLVARACFAGKQEHSEAMRPIARCYRGGLAGRRCCLNIATIRLRRRLC